MREETLRQFFKIRVGHGDCGARASGVPLTSDFTERQHGPLEMYVNPIPTIRDQAIRPLGRSPVSVNRTTADWS